MNEKLEKMLNSLKGKMVNLWHDGAFITPVITLERFEWWLEEDKNGSERLVFSEEGEEETYKVNFDALFDVRIDEATNEIILTMENGETIQIFGDIK